MKPNLNPEGMTELREMRREYLRNECLKIFLLFAFFLSPVIFFFVAWVYPPIEQLPYAVWHVISPGLPVLLMLLAFWGIVQLLSLSQDNRELKEKNRQLKGQIEELKYHIYLLHWQLE